MALLYMLEGWKADYNMNEKERLEAYLEKCDMKNGNYRMLIRNLRKMEEQKEQNPALDLSHVVGQSEQLICPICGLDGFEDQADLEIHLEDCED